jgi:hypothetical protein
MIDVLRCLVPDPKLRELRPEFCGIISGILLELKNLGFEPRISNALRTEEQQREKVRLGYAMPGATGPGTHGWGLACDIIDARWGWRVSEANAKFFAALCDLATAARLTCGGTWFGRGGTRHKPVHKSVWNKWGLGWDPAHVSWESAPVELRKTYVPED